MIVFEPGPLAIADIRFGTETKNAVLENDVAAIDQEIFRDTNGNGFGRIDGKHAAAERTLSEANILRRSAQGAEFVEQFFPQAQDPNLSAVTLSCRYYPNLSQKFPGIDTVDHLDAPAAARLVPLTCEV